MGFYATTASVTDRAPLEDFNVPPPPDAPKGTLTGTVTDSRTGLGVPGADIRLGPLNSHTDASGRYTLTVPQGRYPRLRYAATGYDENTSAPFSVAGGTTRLKDVVLDHDWAAAASGARISDQSIGADSEGTITCGPASMLTQDHDHGWVMANPTPLPPFEPSEHPPFAVVELPRAIDVDHIGIDPSARCLGGHHPDQSAALREYRLEVSQDGRTFRPFAGDGHGTFGPGDLERLNLIAPDGDNGRHVRFVRIEPLEPQDESCSDFCEGSFELNVGQLEVFGVVPGSASAPPAATPPAAARPASAPAAAARPTVRIPASGRHGRIAVAVTCAGPCAVHARLVASAATAKRDRLRQRTLASATRTVRSTATVTLKLAPSVVRALKRRHERAIRGTITVAIAGGPAVRRGVSISR